MVKTQRFWNLAFWFYLGLVISICVAAYNRLIPTEISVFPYYDTILHFLLIGLSAYIAHLAFRKPRIIYGKFHILIVPVTVFILRLIDESIQYFVPSRSFDIFDLTADLLGIILFTYLAEKTTVKN